ncbi:esterase/lipase family protein [Streptomyces sp. SP18CS02]|uniref:esterase/lipase family protein n=1 Tax=Streptomyces sp. SP18CS02 TaxID=3002531 RepID=UPI002E75ADF2|nr:triacylglycerol lipase [Streptomyces sp. SP18CS02]MEE1754717.1 triacylglycerol lipase [Streptomyces sp. SP18CS02]
MNSALLRTTCAVALAFAALPSEAAAAPAVSAEAPATTAAVPDPIVFVHGWNSSGSTWNTMADRFRSDGWPNDRLYQWTYASTQANATTAAQLAQEIDRVLAATGAARVDLVTHSLGSLSSRYYLKNLGGDRKVDAWVSLAGPNHGTDTAYWCGGAACAEMRPGSAFLNALNAGDETPGTPRYATWKSPCDIIINPDSTVSLTGAVNNLTTCLGHTEFPLDASVYGSVRAHIADQAAVGRNG